MTYEVEFRLPSSTQYAYTNLTVKGETYAELEANLTLAFDSESVGLLIGNLEARLNHSFTRGENGEVPAPPVGQPVAAPAPVAQQDVAPAPWQRAAAPAAAPAPKPWEKPALPAAPATTAPANGEYTGPRVKLPFLDQNDAEMAAYIQPRQDAIKQFYAQFKNSFGWNKEERCYRFHHNPDNATAVALQEFNAAWGGELI